MKKMTVVAVMMLTMLSVAAVMAQPVNRVMPILEGQDYTRLTQTLPDGGGRIEVIEFFSYACPHCKDFEPLMTEWEKKHKSENVKLTLVPVSFRPSWELLARAYYASELLGITRKTHHEFFKAIHEQRKEVNSLEQIADIFLGMGIDRKRFLDAMNSFAVETSLRRDTQLVAKYGLAGVPCVAVNGRYISSGSMAGGHPRLIETLNFLVAEEGRRLNLTLGAGTKKGKGAQKPKPVKRAGGVVKP